MKVEREVYIVKNMKVIAQNNELKFQRLLEPFSIIQVNFYRVIE
jgi:hypothetical protein